MSSIIKVDQIQLADGSTPTAGDLGLNTTGSVLQVVQSQLAEPVSVTLNTAFTEITGLTQSITLSSVSSKVLINFAVHVGDQDGTELSYPKIRMLRAGSIIGVGSNDDRQQVTAMWNPGNAARNTTGVLTMSWLDSPSTSGSVEYKLEIFGSQNRTFIINRAGSNENTAGGQAVSTMTLMEIAG